MIGEVLHLLVARIARVEARRTVGHRGVHGGLVAGGAGRGRGRGRGRARQRRLRGGRQGRPRLGNGVQGVVGLGGGVPGDEAERLEAGGGRVRLRDLLGGGRDRRLVRLVVHVNLEQSGP